MFLKRIGKIILIIIEKKVLNFGEGGIVLRNRWGRDWGVLNSYLNRNYLECIMLVNV